MESRQQLEKKLSKNTSAYLRHFCALKITDNIFKKNSKNETKITINSVRDVAYRLIASSIIERSTIVQLDFTNMTKTAIWNFKYATKLVLETEIDRSNTVDTSKITKAFSNFMKEREKQSKEIFENLERER